MLSLRSLSRSLLLSSPLHAAALAALVASPLACADAAPTEEGPLEEAQSAASSTVNIVGHVGTSSGQTVPGAVIHLNGSLQATTVSDSNGNYVFRVPPGSYSLNPSLPGATLTPDVVNLNSLSADVVQSFSCSGACASGPAIVAGRELVITDPTVVTDARASNATMGPWSFDWMMTQMAPAGTDPADFVGHWLSQFEIPGGTINGFPVDVRTTAALRGIWPTNPANGKLDLTKAPFQLLAIVNRVDLHATGDGELRFVYGAVDQTGVPQAMTVIFEFGLPTVNPQTHAAMTRSGWASRFHQLGSLSFGSSYNAALEAITDLVTAANTSPSKPGGSSINQVRSNEILMNENGIWQLREFHLSTASGSAQLTLSPTAQTPVDSANTAGTPENQVLSSFLTSAALPVQFGFAAVPSNILGGGADESFTWSLPAPVTNAALRSFAGQTCNGCHNSDAANQNIGGFYQISPFPPVGTDGTGRLSPLITSVEIPRRTAFMQNMLTCSGSSCAPGAEPLLVP
jgi:hypothetical protein